MARRSDPGYARSQPAATPRKRARRLARFSFSQPLQGLLGVAALLLLLTRRVEAGLVVVGCGLLGLAMWSW